ncbi:XRE family transcriptional regulator [Flavobacterium cerinum]|uniref:XRE family transcriptional regulator n=1 Tax=Flavobacterium cerinum TaxID=2502784 RepID=A0A444HBB3_9FLAO|nr:XRE family transcriptional regulator [Flavobacterium cerinum]
MQSYAKSRIKILYRQICLHNILYQFAILSVKNNEDILFLKALGQKIKKIRTEKGYTQAQLSADLGMEISQISRIERGVVNTSVLNLKKIASLLNVSIKDLFGSL